MAGLGEASFHIAAFIFYVEAISQIRKDASCTSGLCSWLSPSCRKVEYAPISDIDFRTYKKKRRIECRSACSTNTYISKQSIITVHF